MHAGFFLTYRSSSELLCTENQKLNSSLFECGEDRAARDKKGRTGVGTALELAKKYNHPRIVEILSKK
jgi:hypothetical protein